jgi:hypothetical protein
MGAYVSGRTATAGLTPPERANVSYAPILVRDAGIRCETSKGKGCFVNAFKLRDEALGNAQVSNPGTQMLTP